MIHASCTQHAAKKSENSHTKMETIPTTAVNSAFKCRLNCSERKIAPSEDLSLIVVLLGP
eukprot:2340765-Rhodomonas_salina.2